MLSKIVYNVSSMVVQMWTVYQEMLYGISRIVITFLTLRCSLFNRYFGIFDEESMRETGVSDA